jgi:cell division protease FtsH
MLESKRDKLDEMARALLDKEVLGPKDLVRILGKRPFGEYVNYKGAAAGDGLPDLPVEPATDASAEVESAVEAEVDPSDHAGGQA